MLCVVVCCCCRCLFCVLVFICRCSLLVVGCVSVVACNFICIIVVDRCGLFCVCLLVLLVGVVGVWWFSLLCVCSFARLLVRLFDCLLLLLFLSGLRC